MGGDILGDFPAQNSFFVANADGHHARIADILIAERLLLRLFRHVDVVVARSVSAAGHARKSRYGADE